MSDQGPGPVDPPAEGPNPFSREGAAEPTPGAAGPWPPAVPPPSPPPAPQSPPAPQPQPPYQPAPPYQPGGYSQPGSYGDPGYGDPGYPPPGYGPPGYPVDPYPPAGYGGYGYGGYGYGGPVDHPQATPALVTGIIGLVLGVACGVGGLTGIAGVVLGTRAKREIDADPARWTGRGKASAGVVTGVIGLGVLVLWILLIVGVTAF